MNTTDPANTTSGAAVAAPVDQRVRPLLDDWGHLMAYGYAPGLYMSACHQCKLVFMDLDKRAITCRPCAERMHAERLAADGLKA